MKTVSTLLLAACVLVYSVSRGTMQLALNQVFRVVASALDGIINSLWSVLCIKQVQKGSIAFICRKISKLRFQFP